MAKDILFIMCRDIRRWINHSKEGYQRSKDDLVYFDKLWRCLSHIVIQLSTRISQCDEEERDIIRMIRYEGRLFRIHKKYNKCDTNYGVQPTIHYVSWTKTNNFDDLYWLSRGSDFVTITAETTQKLFAIDLVGFNDYINKYYDPKFTIGSPAIIKEQEVVFPIDFSTIQDITPRKWIKQ